MGLVSIGKMWVLTLFSMCVRASVCNQSAIHSITRKQLKSFGLFFFSKTNDIRFA